MKLYEILGWKPAYYLQYLLMKFRIFQDEKLSCKNCKFYSTKTFCNVPEYGCYLQAPAGVIHHEFELTDLRENCKFKNVKK